LQILEDHIYADEALSGVGSDRPAVKRILELALSRTPPFTAILVDDTSRLSRTTEDALTIFKRLNFAGVQLIAVSQGIDSDHEQSEMLVTVHGLVDSLYVRELAKKIHRGMEGLALRGLHTGGRIFGYDAISTGEGAGKKLVVNQTEATIVKRIFELSAGGHSLKAITKTLNAERVSAPRPREGRIGGEWCPTAIREMLRNELYIGNVVWNRSKFVKVPGTNKRQRRMRPESEWLRSTNLDLSIISQDLWKVVRTRFAALPAIWGYQKRPGLLSRAMTSPYLFSGLLKCGNCGANLIIATGGGSARLEIGFSDQEAGASGTRKATRGRQQSSLPRSAYRDVYRLCVSLGVASAQPTQAVHSNHDSESSSQTSCSVLRALSDAGDRTGGSTTVCLFRET